MVAASLSRLLGQPHKYYCGLGAAVGIMLADGAKFPAFSSYAAFLLSLPHRVEGEEDA